MYHIKTRILDKRINHEWPLNSKGSKDAAAIDLRACIDYPMTIAPGETLWVPLGLAIHIDHPGIAALILPRSGLGSHHGIVLGNLVGLIDPDYQGPLKACLWNRSAQAKEAANLESDYGYQVLVPGDHAPYTLTPGERIAQLMFVPTVPAKLQIVDSFEFKTERDESGFGHSGKI